MIIQTVIEVLRGGKPGDRHWVPTNQWIDDEHMTQYTGCGLPANTMVSDLASDPQRLTCLECRTKFSANYLATRD